MPAANYLAFSSDTKSMRGQDHLISAKTDLISWPFQSFKFDLNIIDLFISGNSYNKGYNEAKFQEHNIPCLDSKLRIAKFTKLERL